MDKGNDAVRFSPNMPLHGLSWLHARTLDGTDTVALPIWTARRAETRVGYIASEDSPERTSAGFVERYPGLHRAFAELDPGPEAFLAFAERWGYLGLGERLEHSIGSPRASSGESIEAWHDAHDLLARGISLWTALDSEDLKRIEAELGGSRRRRYTPDGEDGTTVVAGLHIKLRTLRGAQDRSHFSTRQHFPEGNADPTRVGWHALSALIDENLSHNSSARFRATTRSGDPGVSVEPDNLFGAMWLAFAVEVEGVTQISRCNSCGTIFVENVRTDKEQCDNCRRQTSRKRLNFAGELAATEPEMSSDEIVAEVLARHPVEDKYLDRALSSIAKRVQKAR